MQGKEASEQETKVKSSVGIDVSKNWLDVHVLPGDERLRVANTGDGIRQLKRWLLALSNCAGGGRGDRQVASSSASKPGGLRHRGCRRRSYRVRMFAKAQGIFAKTDRLDARVLALVCRDDDAAGAAAGAASAADLAELVTARASAVEAQTALKNQLAAASGKFLKRQLDRRIEQRRQGYRSARCEILKRIKADDELGQTLCHPDLDPGLRLRGRRNPHRLPGRDRRHHRQTDRHARRLRPDRRPIRASAKVSASSGADAQPCAVSSISPPSPLPLQRRHEGLLRAAHRQWKTAKGRPHRRRQKARRSWQIHSSAENRTWQPSAPKYA